jgi:hypothetical protein
MELYAIEIQKEQLALITLLNQGVTPAIQEEATYFVFDAEWNSEVPNQIMTQDALLEEHSKITGVHIHKVTRAQE